MVKTPLIYALGMLALTVAGLAGAIDFKSVTDNGAILYDAPSGRAKKLFVASRGYPLQVLVTVQGFSKVRDAANGLSWIEAKSLSARRTVMIKAPMADIRRTAADDAPVAFQAARGVLLDLIEVGSDGWAHVTHADGQGGYVKLSQIWGT